MLKIKIAFLALFVSLFAVPQTYADVLIEPYLGYHLGKTKSGSATSNDKGISYGGRLGYQTMGFMIGAEYQSGSWTDDSTPQDTITPSYLGAFVGYNFPVLFRVYGTYFFSADSKASNSSSSVKYTGNGYKLGVGYTGFPFVSVNLEYGSTSFDKGNSQTLSNNVDTNFYGLTISVPFDL